MLFLLVSILLNALLILIFRVFGTYKVQNLPAIVINYLVCYILGSFFSSGRLITYEGVSEPWLWMIGGLGLTFIITFNAVAMTVQRFSITIAALMQRMSVVMVVVYALFYFHEQLSFWQAIGLVAGIISIYLISKGRGDEGKTRSSPYLLLPISCFLLSGVIEISFYHMSRIELTLGQEDKFATLLFFTAGLFGTLVLGTRMARGMRVHGRDIIGGIALGIPNYFSIYFYQKMLTSDLQGAVIMPTHNIGILLLSSVLSYLLFKEHFYPTKRIGLVLAILAVLLLTNA